MISKNQVKLIRQLEQKKHRMREGLFVAEGPKVVGDLLRRMPAEALFATADYLDAVGLAADVQDSLRARSERRRTAPHQLPTASAAGAGLVPPAAVVAVGVVTALD